MHHKKPEAGSEVTLPITPMLDMSFQILSFFIMTYHPSALEGHIPGSLAPPESGGAVQNVRNAVVRTCRLGPTGVSWLIAWTELGLRPSGVRRGKVREPSQGSRLR